MDLPCRDVIFYPLCHVATWTHTSRRGPTRRDVDSHVTTSKSHASVTSRRGLLTSRCHFYTSLSRRDVISYMSLSRRDVASNVATWIKSTLCHVATWPPTSRRRLVKLSVTSRRDPARRDVTPHVATSPWFKAKISSFFGPSPYAPLH